MQILKYCYWIILLFALISTICNFGKLNNSLKPIGYYVLISSITESIGFYSLAYNYGVANTVYNIFGVLELILLSMFFYQIFLSNYSRKFILFLLPILIIINIYSAFIPSKFFNNNIVLLSQFYFSLLSVLYFLQLLKVDIDLWKWPYFWICLAILFFSTSNYFVTGLINFIQSKNLALARQLFSINHLLNIIYYSLITYGFICQARLAKRS